MGLAKTEAKPKSRWRMMMEGWHSLEVRRRKLEAAIQARKEYIERLRRSLDVSIYRSPIIDGMPRPTDYGDSVGNMVARTLDKITRTALQVMELEQELAQVMLELTEVETSLLDVKPEYQEVLRLVFRDRQPIYYVERVTKYSRPRIYEIIEEVDRAKSGLV